MMMLLLCAACWSSSCVDESAPRQQQPPEPRGEFEQIARGLRDGFNPYLGRGSLRELRARLADPTLDDAGRFGTLFELAEQELQQGESAAAVRHIDEALALLEEMLPRVPQGSALHRGLPLVLAARAMAYLRLAEDRNCIAHHTPESCLFPIRGEGRHVDAVAAGQAMATFERYLALRPDSLRERWLLNIAAMALGRYPQDVPQHLRIPPRRLESEREVRRFADIAGRLGVDPINLAGGVVTEDFDGDGLLDIVTSTYDPEGSLIYFRNRGDGGFDDLSSGSGLDRQLGGLNCIGADYDNDGDPDLLVLRGAWLGETDGRIRNSLLRNEGRGRFRDVTRDAGIADPAMPTQAAAWGDFDQDGDLDLVVVHESPPETETRFPSLLFRNNGDGTFTDVAEAAGITNDRFAKGVTVGDYDNDGDPDIFVSMVVDNRLYRNEGDGTFTDVAPSLGVEGPRGYSFAPWFFDFDNDGWLDLFVGAYDATVSDVAADYFGEPHDADSPRLYRNNGDGTFTDVAGPMGLGRPFLPMGANFGDIDNDGFLDIYLGTGDPDYRSIMPNVLLRNDAGRRFEDVTFSAGLGHLQKGHGIAFADFDHDGDQDIYHQLGGFVPGDRFQNALFENPGPPARFLKIRLVGVSTNRSGFGARLRVVVRGAGGTREIHRAAGSVSSFGGSSTVRHEIGLGAASAVESVEVWWPASGTRSTYRDVPLDALIEITEGSAALRELPHRPFALGGR